MANKKIPVFDSADESLTPEEEQAIEVKVDKMLDPSRPDKPPAEVLPPSDSSASDVMTEPASAPPLPKKLSKKIMIADDSQKSVTEADTSVASPEAADTELSGNLVEELPRAPLDIGTDDLLAASQEPITEEVAEDILDLPAAQKAGEPLESEESGVKKYRPPDGPLPFKRAQPAPETEKPAMTTSKSRLGDADQASKTFSTTVTRSGKLSRKARPKSLRSRLIKLLILLILVGALAWTAAIPKNRATALGFLHVRGSFTATVIDATTRLPLSGAVVQIGDARFTTDQNGQATLSQVNLGPKTVSVQKAGFADTSRRVLLAWKTTRLPVIAMQASGPHYTLNVSDYVSSKPVPAVLATSGSAQASGDNQGRVVLVIPAAHSKNQTITLKAAGYRALNLPIPVNPKTPVAVKLVPATDDLYMMKEAGRYNLYKVGLDDKNPSLLLAGSGYERALPTLVPNATNAQAVLVSTRDNVHDKAGSLLDTLTLVNASNNAATAIDHAQTIKIVGWFGKQQLVYSALTADSAATDPARYQLFSYNTVSKKRTELDHANNFNDIAVANGVIYYATANHFTGGTSQLVKLNPATGSKQILLSSEVTSIFRTDYQNLLLATASTWYTYHLGDKQPTTTNSTYGGVNRLYLDSPDGLRSVWIDTTKHQIVLYTKATNVEKTILTQPGVTYPVHWLTNNALVYRVVTGSAASDEVMDVQASTGKTITTVADADGLTLW